MSSIFPKFSKVLIVVLVILLLGLLIVLLFFLYPQSYISKTADSHLLSAMTAISQRIRTTHNSITTDHQFSVEFENENSGLGKVKINKTRVKMAKISTLLDKLNKQRKPEDQIQEISMLVTDIPQTKSYAWEDASGDKIYYSGFSLKEIPDEKKIQSNIYLNVAEMKKYGWNNDDIFRELEFLFYLSLLTSNNDTEAESAQKYQEARTIYLEANIDDTVQLFSITE